MMFWASLPLQFISDLNDQFKSLSHHAWVLKRRLQKHIIRTVMHWSLTTSRDLNNKSGKSYLTALKNRIWQVVIFEADGALEQVLKPNRNRAELGLGDVEEGETEIELESVNECIEEIANDKRVTIEEIRSCFDDYRPLSYAQRKILDPIVLYKDDMYTVLYLAIQRKHTQNAKYLLKHFRLALHRRCGPSRGTALSEAVERCNWDIVSGILNSPFMSPSQYINIGDGLDFTPLHYLVGHHHSQSINQTEILDKLLWHGADIDALNSKFHTPLHWLIDLYVGGPLIDNGESQSWIDLLDYFLTAGAEVNTKDIDGMDLDSRFHSHSFMASLGHSLNNNLLAAETET